MRGGGRHQAALAAGLAAALLAGCGGAKSRGDTAPASGDRTRRSHPEEPDDGVSLTTSRGVLEPDQIRAIVEPHSNDFSTCYINRVGDRRWLGGKLQLKWELDEGGAVQSVHVNENDLGAWPVEKCVLAVARRLKFPPPRGGATDFTVPLEFSATGSAVVWDEAKSAAALAPHLGKLAACAELPTPSGPSAKAAPTDATSPAAPTEPTAPTEASLALYIGAQGQILSIGFAVEDPTGFTERWAECAYAAALSWKLAEPRVPVAKLTVRYTPPPAAP